LMFLIRRAKPEDLDIILKLSKTVHFINLPADKDIIAEKIRRSRHSFAAAATGNDVGLAPEPGSAVSDSPVFIFVMEDSETGNCVGCSMVVSRMGGPGHPNLSFMLEKRERFSKDLQTGATHTVARLYKDESGPSEIGGLILGPSFRRHPQRLGKQLSLVRFHMMGLFRQYFSDRILAEMMAPISADGRSVFWDALGRRFINLAYDEADRFCQHSREFMTSLLPEEDIYLTLLPAEARRVVGQVGPDTEPAKRMLEQIGFQYTGRIDPFDGGPHLEAHTDAIELVRHTRWAGFGGVTKLSDATERGFVSTLDDQGNFRCLHCRFAEGKNRSLLLPKQVVEMLEVEEGARLGLTELDLTRRTANAVTAAKKRRSGKKKAAGGKSKARVRS